MDRKLVILLLAFGHGLNDLIAGYFLGRLAQSQTDIIEISIGLFLYNLIAFGGQYPVALLLEKIKKPKQFLLLAYGLNVLAVSFFTIASHLSIVLAGVASAVYHVAGGSVCAEKNKAADIGLFAAPGIAGLIGGGYLAFNGINIMLPLFLTACLFLAVIYFLQISSKATTGSNPAPATGKFSIDRHDMIMILLLTVISLRSVIWNVFQLIHENNYEWLTAIAGAAVVGKIAGGWLADRIGWRLYAISSLIIATPLLNFFKDELLLFCIGIGLLQSGIPATTSLLIQAMPGRKERAVGLSFGTAIIVGALIFYSPIHEILSTPAGICCIAAIMLLFLMKINPVRSTLPSRKRL